MDTIIENTSLGIAIIGGVIIIGGIIYTLIAILNIIVSRLRPNATTIPFFSSLGNIRYHLAVPLLLGLDFLIAADIVHTILEHSLEDLALLGGIVAIRIALSYFLMIEIKSIDKTEK